MEKRPLKRSRYKIIRLYVHAVYCYRPSSVVCLTVTLVSPTKTAEPIEMPFRLRTREDPRNHVLDGGPGPLMGRSNFKGGKGWLVVKYRDTLRSPVREQLKRSICRLGCGLGWAKGSTSSIVFARWRQCTLMQGHTGATWRIRLNRPSEVAMWSYIELL